MEKKENDTRNRDLSDVDFDPRVYVVMIVLSFATL